MHYEVEDLIFLEKIMKSFCPFLKKVFIYNRLALVAIILAP
jgi:hypothetical protein